MTNENSTSKTDSKYASSIKHFIRPTILLIVTLMLASIIAACSSGDERTITLGSRNNTESIILSNIMAELIRENTDIKVVQRDNLGGSNVLWKGLLENEIQLIPDYSGTIVVNYYQDEPGTAEETLDKAIELISDDGLTGFDAFGFNNTYTLSIDETFAEENNIVTFSDFATYSEDFTLGAVFEFIDRPDGLPGFQEAYDIHFEEVKGMDHGIMYRAYEQGETNVINSYTTDGQLQIFDVRVLEDDKNFFPPYHALPIIRKDALEEFPELEALLKQLGNQIDEATMQKLNAQVDNDGMKVDAVAKQFLNELNLIN